MEYREITEMRGPEGKLVGSVVENACSTLRMILNKQCQLACSWCYREGIDHGNAEEVLSPDTFVRVVQAAKSQGFKSVNFSGGEPLLYPDLFRVQREASKNGMQSYVTTNGVAIEQSGAVEQWKTIPDQEVHVSLNTVDEEEYRSITGRRVLQSVLRGISQLVAAHIPVKLNCVVPSEAEWPKIKRVIDYAGNMGLTLKLLGVHDAEQPSFSQRAVGEMLLKNGAEHAASSCGGGINYGYEQFIVGQTRVHVLDMVYGGGCCERFRSDHCGEGIRYPRVVYTGEIRPCLHQSMGHICDESPDAEIARILGEAKQFLCKLSILPFHLDSIVS